MRLELKHASTSSVSQVTVTSSPETGALSRTGPKSTLSKRVTVRGRNLDDLTLRAAIAKAGYETE